MRNYVKLVFKIDGRNIASDPLRAQMEYYVLPPTRENAERLISALNPEGRKAYEAAIWAEVEKHEASR